MEERRRLESEAFWKYVYPVFLIGLFALPYLLEGGSLLLVIGVGVVVWLLWVVSAEKFLGEWLP